MSETTPPAGSDATLKTLAISAGEMVPAFSGDRPSFAVVLPHAVESVTLTPGPADPAARIIIAGQAAAAGVATDSLPLAVGRNAITVEVTAADGVTRRQYEIRIHRAIDRPNWVRLREACPWSRRDSQGELAFDGRMWLLGGYTPDLVRDVWASADGLEWRQTGTVPTEAGINIPVCVAFKGRMWVSDNQGRFFASPDGAAWELVCERPPWAGRYGAGSVVFRDRMWVMGGFSAGRLFNDVWSSSDGANWTREVDEAPWSPRQVFSNVVVHQDKLWLIGGGVTSYQPFRAYRDVWCSEDGRKWEKVCDHAPFPQRIWTSCAVYRNRIWLLGGFRAQPTWNNFNDVWYTADGCDWRRLKTEAIWEPRHEISAYVFDDALWVVGGNAWPLMHDVWQLRIPGLTFLSEPVQEEYVRAEYRYQAQADFHESATPLRYRLAEGPAWLTIDAESGWVTGRPPAAGAHAVTVEARSAAGETARQSYTLHVIEAG